MALFQTKHLWIRHLADDVASVVLDRHNSATNFLDPAMLDDFSRALDAVTLAAQYRLLVLCSAKTANFCQGIPASLLADWTREDYAAWAEQGQQLCTKISSLPMPVVAVLAGSCLDAGLELVLACDYRVVVNKPATSLGFPGLAWGLIPCWGATQRLPHLIGLENSLHMLLGSEQQNAREAWLGGLADELVEEGDDTPPTFLADPSKRDWSSFPRRTWRENYLESNRLGRWFVFRGAERIVRKRIPAEMPAPVEMLAAVRIVYQHSSMQPGLDFERQALARIVAHPALHHSLRLLLHREQLRSVSSSGSGKRRIHHVGIVGANVLGLSLLLQAVSKGYEVVLRARDDLSLGAALTQIIHILQDEVRSGTMSETHFQKTLSAIRGTYTWTHFDKLDFVVDCAEGTLSEKQSFYQEMENQISAQTLLVSASLAHRVEDLRSVLRLPDRLLGLHIIEPWNRGSLAEIVVPTTMGRTMVQQVQDWAIRLGKCSIEVPDRLGGLVMRIWLPALNEAGLLIREGVAIHTIDEAMRRFGMTYGPLEWMDRLGLDHVAAIMMACQAVYMSRITFESGFSLMVEKQWLGYHTDLGFYRRRFGGWKPHRDAELLWRTKSQGEDAHPLPSLSQADMQNWIQKRLVTLTVLESIRCLQEGVVSEADDLDCAMCLTGWATHRGGPIGYARQLGCEAVAATCADLTQEFGGRFAAVAAMQEILSRL